MNERLMRLRARTRERNFRKHRDETAPSFVEDFDREGLSWTQRAARLTQEMCAAKRVVIDPDERITFTQTVPPTSRLYSDEEWARLTGERTLHEGVAVVNNICPNWGKVLADGLVRRREGALEAKARLADEPGAVEFLDAAVETIDAVLDLAAQYAKEARRVGREDLAETLEQVPAQPPRTFREALQSLRLLSAVPWFVGHYQIGLGRFDQYMWPYLQRDLEHGQLDREEAQGLLAEFFIALNRDADLYPGVQPGDNGQTITLGGVTRSGKPAVNPLTRMALRAAYEVALIDPKINLRIGRGTDLDLLTEATRLTSKGLGFPQYLNDDVIIPALAGHGYELEDARDYTVAACWEVIIPGVGMEVVNIGAVSFPAAADRALRQALAERESFKQVLDRAQREIAAQARRLLKDYEQLLLAPSPLLSVLMEGCLECGRDLSRGLKYNNFGIHGAGAANAADALGAAKKFVFDEQSVTAQELLEALAADFEGDEDLREKLCTQGPRVGNDDDQVDGIMVDLFDAFAEACESYGTTSRGGIVRPGAATAMYYMWLAQAEPGMREPTVGATADGRSAGEPFSANLAPSPGARVAGPLSVLQSFSKLDPLRIYNGGPVTMEFSEGVFRNDDALRKVALFVRAAARLGVQQLQLNTLNRAQLLEAKRHPERHRDLIVRVWGWSGYFCELAPEYQDHVIARHVYGEDQVQREIDITRATSS
jgi:formate C-acetyltransferase